MQAIQAIIPLGNLNPPGHTIPTNHIYINNRPIGGPPVSGAPVFAPGDGTVQWVILQVGDSKVGVKAGASTYYLGHVRLDSSVVAGARITAGQRLGSTNLGVYGIDLGVFNEQVTVPFVNPARYSGESLHGDKDGAFNHDVRDRLAGNWFLDGLAPSVSENDIAWSQQLAFVFDNYDPSAIRVSIGGTLSIVGAFAVQPDAVNPRDVSVSSGKTTYRLLRAGLPGGKPEGQVGLLIVQMISGDRIRAETIAGESLSAAEFSSGAPEYVR